MITNYDPFIDRVINKYEGGYCWNRGDPGGPTKYGITCYDLAEHRGLKMDSMSKWAEIVEDMTLSEAEDIYRIKYANGIRFNSLPSGPDCCMLDYGINSGVSRAVNVGRAILGLSKGGMDDIFVTACLKYDPKKFVDSMCQERLAFMHAIRGGSAWAEFGRGWGARVADVQGVCDHLVGHGAPPPAPDLHTIPKATHPTPGKVAPRSTTGAGAVLAGIAAYFAGLHWEIVAGVVVLSTCVGVGFEMWQHDRLDAANAKIHLPI